MGFLTGTEMEAPAPIAVRAGAYLTDGTKLLRIESELRDVEGEHLVEIEDCATLDRWVWLAEELAGLDLRPVEPRP